MWSGGFNSGRYGAQLPSLQWAGGRLHSSAQSWGSTDEGRAKAALPSSLRTVSSAYPSLPLRSSETKVRCAKAGTGEAGLRSRRSAELSPRVCLSLTKQQPAGASPSPTGRLLKSVALDLLGLPPDVTEHSEMPMGTQDHNWLAVVLRRDGCDYIPITWNGTLAGQPLTMCRKDYLTQSCRVACHPQRHRSGREATCS